MAAPRLKSVNTFPQTEFGLMRWDRFDGGLNTRFPTTQIDRHEAQDCRNVYTDLRGALVKRKGYELFSQDGSDVPKTFWPYYDLQAGGSFNRYILKASGTVVRAFNGSTWSDIITGLTSGLRHGYATGNNNSYFANGTNGLYQWTGTGSATSVAAAPSGTWILMWHANRMWALTGQSSRVYFSDLGDPTSWPALNFIDFDVDDGDKLIGMASINDSAAVFFKERSRHMLRGTGPGNFTSYSYRDGRGAVSPFAIVTVGELGMAAVLDRDMVYLTNGPQVRNISDKIEPTVRQWAQQYLHLACMAFYREHLHLCVPNDSADTGNTYMYLYDINAKSWWPQNIAAGHLAVYFDGTSEALLSSSTTTGKLYEQWSGNSDEGAAINAYWKGKDDAREQETRRKRYKRGFATQKAYEGTHDVRIVWNQDFGAQSVSMEVPVNTGTFPVFDEATFDNSVFVSSEGVVTGAKMVATESAYVRPEVYQEGIDEPFAILSLALEAKLTNRRVGVAS